MRPTVCALLLLTFGSVSVRAEDWPQFRGPHGDGISEATDVPVTWSRDENIRWRVPLAGDANSSPIVSNGRVFTTTASDQGRYRTLRCFDRETGYELWSRTVAFDEDDPTHKTNPYAASTPAADGERVVVWHGSAGLFCYDFDGTELWSRDLGTFRHLWGYGSSPVIHEGRIVMNCGPGLRVFMTAIDLADGHTLWEQDEPHDGDGEYRADHKYMGSWSTPTIANIDGQTQIICSMPTRVVAYDVASGDINWWCNGLSGPKGDLAYTSTLIGSDIGVAMAGFNGPAIGFKPGGRGDVTETNRLWRVEDRIPQRIGSGILLNDVVFMANAGPSTAECIDAKTGEMLWQARLPGESHWGSLIYAAGRLYGTDQAGTTHVFAPNPEKFEVIASNALGELSNATPAISDGEIFIRTNVALYCVGKVKVGAAEE